MVHTVEIEGVRIKQVVKHEDGRGFFAELVKSGEPTFRDILQTSYAETNPGVIKGFHIHDYWEIWCIIKGQAQVVLHDMRSDSRTFGKTDVIYTGEDNMMVIAIPGEVAHGYQSMGPEPMGIIYHASEAYNPDNITIRTIPFDDPSIGFDWGVKNP
ncbi:dTDP-4-dehydrorhamnose 3,5-epimerase family protein [Candidatus Kaiserbacteria bacterium]|nr:dTDP-4-dehydrorhamnose 3,5-epimerase family protein [Candidatus Kaiserbacteria bacterium]